MDAIFNDKDEVIRSTCRTPGALPGFPDDLVVEVLGRCIGAASRSFLPSRCRATSGAWWRCSASTRRSPRRPPGGTRDDGVRALSANPLVRQVDVAERVYDALAAAHRAHLPDRLLRSAA